MKDIHIYTEKISEPLPLKIKISTISVPKFLFRDSIRHSPPQQIGFKYCTSTLATYLQTN